MRAHKWFARLSSVVFMWVFCVLVPSPVLAQQVTITPEPSVTPTKTITPWVFGLAIITAVLGGLALLGILTGYLRFAPKFFGRQMSPSPGPPGARPPLLRQAQRSGAAPAASTRPAVASAAPRAQTAVADRGSPPEEASGRPTAPPAGEQAVQADAAGQAEAAAPEQRPSAKTRTETGAPEAETAPEATAEGRAEPAPSTETPVSAAQAGAGPAPASDSHGAATLDQETFDRVLQEQLAKGMDRRVAEGRARAAAVVAARKKAQA